MIGVATVCDNIEKFDLLDKSEKFVFDLVWKISKVMDLFENYGHCGLIRESTDNRIYYGYLQAIEYVCQLMFRVACDKSIILWMMWWLLWGELSQYRAYYLNMNK